MGGEIAADEGEEGFGVGNERGGRGNLLGGGDLATAAEGGIDWAEENGKECWSGPRVLWKEFHAC